MLAGMRAIETVFALVWAAFWLYWLAAALTTKPGHIPWSRHFGIRAVLLLVAILVIRAGMLRHHFAAEQTDAWRVVLGLVLLVGGLGLAVWARVNIGRSWGVPMTQQENPELVTSGPYRLVRHPIYTGILLAGVGSAVALDWVWLVVVVLAGVYFIYSATVEERYLTEQLPDRYPKYKDSTKMLVPFVF
jgi:protein-S-isoprenylcysteine O-methyltransferase Ste14